jgi:hypothetical protein
VAEYAVAINAAVLSAQRNHAGGFFVRSASAGRLVYICLPMLTCSSAVTVTISVMKAHSPAARKRSVSFG